jgi:hypothetical protein
LHIQCYQGYELPATASGEKFFEPNEKSEAERLQMLYVDSKHMDRMIDGGKIPTEVTAAIWITNHGLESSRATLSFDELIEMLLNMGRLAAVKARAHACRALSQSGRSGNGCAD